MRAKIITQTNLSDTDIRGRLEENGWWLEQDGPRALEIKQRILDTIAPEHRDLARDGAKFSIVNDLTTSEGLISSESNFLVIRVRNDGIVSLQRDCEKIVHFLANYCRQVSGKHINFPAKIEVLEVRNRNVVIEGFVVATREARINHAREEKSLELFLSKIGAVIIAVLLLLTFPYPFLRDFRANNESAMWAIDILGKLIGSVTLTTFISYLGYRVYRRSLRDSDIIWNIPKQEL